MAQDKTAPPSTYTQLDDGDPDEDVIWSSKRAVLIESWSEMWWRENVTLPLRNCGLAPYAGPTTYKLTKNELVITFRSWDRYTQCLLPKKAVLETSRHIDLDHIISVSTTATARPYGSEVHVVRHRPQHRHTLSCQLRCLRLPCFVNTHWPDARQPEV